MSITWLAPLALSGLALIVLPIAIHLFARQPVRALIYPSLRFVRETQLSFFRRRRIEDAALLVCRIGIVAAAAAALAGPVVNSPSRLAGYANRMSRAIVTTADAPAGGVADLERDVFRSARFQRATVADAIAEASRWLAQQPPSAREVVVIGSLRRGAITAADFEGLPAGIGVRFEQTGSSGPESTTTSVLAHRDGGLVRIDRPTRLTPDATIVSDGSATPVAGDLAAIFARPADKALADAALRAALTAGVPWSDFTRRVAIVWAGADEFGNNAALANAQVIRMPVPSPPSLAADVVHAALSRAGAADRVEPVLVERQQLDGWSRRPGPPDTEAPMADEGDRRWLWAVALALLVIETVLRRSRTEAVVGTVEKQVA